MIGVAVQVIVRAGVGQGEVLLPGLLQVIDSFLFSS